MPEVLEQEPTRFYFNDPENARQAAYKSHEAQAQLKQDGERFRELAIEQAKLGSILPQKPVDQIALQEAQEQITITKEQIARTRERLNDDKACYCDTCKRGAIGDKERAALLRELRGLMEHLCRLNHIAQAPTCKAEPRARATRAPVMPIMPVQPTQPVVDGPDSSQSKPTQ